MVDIKPITLKLDDDLWHDFKSVITKDRTLNEAVVDLIKKHIEDCKEV